MRFQEILEKYRKISFSEKDKGERFERIGTNQLRRVEADGSQGKLLCTRLGGSG